MSKVYLSDKRPGNGSGDSASPYQTPALKLTVINPEGFLCSSIFEYEATIEGHQIGVEADMSDYADQTEWFKSN